MSGERIGTCSLCGGPVGVLCCGQCGAVLDSSGRKVLPMVHPTKPGHWPQRHDLKPESRLSRVEDKGRWPPAWITDPHPEKLR